ncbi:MAG: glycosyltransferase [Chloroflexota bacterium]|nr:glycosyltransferase [Chloroflexota bacterium]
MRLLIVSDTLPPDPNGIGLIALHTAEILAKRADVHVIGPAGACLSPAVRYTRASRLPIGTPDLHLPRPSLRLVSAAVSDADQVIIHTLGPLGLCALYYARRYRRHSTLFVHNDHRALFRHGLPRTPAAFIIDWAAARLERWSTRIATRVVAPWPIARDDCEVLRLDPPWYPATHAPVNGNGYVTIAYHGRVSREKALDATVRAIHTADPGHQRLRFRIIGDGSQLPSTLRLANALGVPFEHIPWCDDPRRELAGAQIYVMASRTETFSMTTLEAIGCGLPLIARSVGQIPSYVKHDVNGLLFDADDQLPALITALATDTDMRTRLAEQASSLTTDESLWDQFADASFARTPF